VSNKLTTAVSIEVKVRRVLLRVSHIERATRFCRDVLGLRVVVYGPDHGLQAAFLRAGRHYFLLTTWDRPQEPQTTQAAGRAYVAICYPTHRSFAAAIRLGQRAGCDVAAAWVQGHVQAVTLIDPDGNAVRLSYRARRPGEFNDHGSRLGSTRIEPRVPRFELDASHRGSGDQSDGIFRRLALFKLS
jgi:catechol-2,3-dioxygenase